MPKGVGYGKMERQVEMGKGGGTKTSGNAKESSTKASTIRKYSGKGRRS